MSTVEQSFSHDPVSVKAARRFVSEQLDDADDATRERVVLLVSELGSNAVRHAGTGFHVAVGRRGAVVFVEVSDSGPGEPSMQQRDATQPTGRGLQLVHDLAREWGVRRGAQGTKTVWFTV